MQNTYFPSVAKIPASTRLAPDALKRLTEISQVDRRSISELIELCVEAHLPYLEVQEQTKRRALEKLDGAALRKREKKVA